MLAALKSLYGESNIWIISRLKSIDIFPLRISNIFFLVPHPWLISIMSQLMWIWHCIVNLPLVIFFLRMVLVLFKWAINLVIFKYFITSQTQFSYSSIHGGLLWVSPRHTWFRNSPGILDKVYIRIGGSSVALSFPGVFLQFVKGTVALKYVFWFFRLGSLQVFYKL